MIDNESKTEYTDKGRVLIVDDEPNAIKVLYAILSDDGYHILDSHNVSDAIEIIRNNEIDSIITDLKMPEQDGMQFFEYLSEKHPEIPVIFLTAYGTVDSAIYAITHGAFYYFIKPPDYIKLKNILAKAVEQRHLKREVEILKARLFMGNNRPKFIGNSPEIINIFKIIEAIKDTDSSVLICGETGTGKEVIANELHYSSQRHEKPFIAVNCAAIPRDLMESEIFGYEKGAFTGAISRRIGKFEEVSGGTIFLDEIGELGPALQAKLLRVIQEKEIERLGSNKKIKVNFRLISSTNCDLRKKVEDRSFREDLFYRINVVQINLPLLRERKEDIPLLVSEFVKEFCIREKKMVTVSDEVMILLQNYSWPGNVRQLKNIIERAVVLAKGKEITMKELPEELCALRKNRIITQSIKTLKELEELAIKDALQRYKGNKAISARVLGISRKTFYKKLKDLRFS